MKDVWVLIGKKWNAWRTDLFRRFLKFTNYKQGYRLDRVQMAVRFIVFPLSTAMHLLMPSPWYDIQTDTITIGDARMAVSFIRELGHGMVKNGEVLMFHIDKETGTFYFTRMNENSIHIGVSTN